MKPYPEYKPTGLDWLGPIPKHWELVRAKQLFVSVDKRSNSGQEELLSVSERFGVVKRSNVNVTMFMAASYEGYKLCWPDDLAINSLWAWSYGLGFSPYYGIISTAYSVFRLKDKGKCLPRFYDYFVRSKKFHWELRVRSKGLWKSRYQLSDDSFLSAPMILPPSDEQEQIVRYLDSMTAKIDKLIRARKQQIELLKEQKQAVINQAVTRGLNPNVELKDSGVNWIGKVPAGWKITQAKRLVKISNGSDPLTSYGETPVYGSGASSFKKCVEFKEGPTVLLGRKGTINIPQWIEGRYWNVDTAFDVKTKNAELKLKFYYYLSICFNYDEYSTKTAIPSMTQTNYYNIKIPVPPLPEQEQIVRYLDAKTAKINELIRAWEKQIAVLEEQKQTLISAVVTGQVDVRNIAVDTVSPDELAASGAPEEAEESDSLTPEDCEAL